LKLRFFDEQEFGHSELIFEESHATPNVGNHKTDLKYAFGERVHVRLLTLAQR